MGHVAVVRVMRCRRREAVGCKPGRTDLANPIEPQVAHDKLDHGTTLAQGVRERQAPLEVPATDRGGGVDADADAHAWCLSEP
jgi:hypothetical protein